MRNYLLKLLTVVTVFLFLLTGSAPAAGVVLYSSNPSELLDLDTKGLEAKTGIKVSVVRLGTGEAMKRIAAEKDKPLCDVFWSGDVAVLETPVVIAGLLAPIRPTVARVQDAAGVTIVAHSPDVAGVRSSDAVEGRVRATGVLASPGHAARLGCANAIISLTRWYKKSVRPRVRNALLNAHTLSA